MLELHMKKLGLVMDRRPLRNDAK